ncbi:xanthine dehydrogenase family protein molybdopterin-binding subunit [Novosphingobium umbonatum]|uniref:Xanthine dehydrogenase family protein molybdopterin-binding subunit n=1 Tax=Novosphingobium umbonatum TaxID=1908524 RepID=A0A3S3TRS8_9SPHN|nr:molybdopterin cofactor-binding domain-containing protein [Novosphingobium umbonatum]RVU07018.1 xanthine dehydrogenase family protein molybdopterin-binding subunit [Novosphingobium umbonatum]
MGLSRRQILVGAAAGGGLWLGFNLLPRKIIPPIAPAQGEVALDAWIRLGLDGVVSIAIPQLEMGQGVLTLLGRIVAEEMGADWRQVSVQMAPPSAAFPNLALARAWAPLWMPLGLETPWRAESWAQDHRFMVTGGGSTLAAYEAPARHAAASARALLAMAAAKRWGVDWQACSVAQGRVTHQGRSLAFGALAQEAAELSPPDPPLLRAAPTSDAPHGKGVLRLDAPAKVDGTWQFAGDVRLPDMVFAAIRHAPWAQEAALGSYDPKRAQGISGFDRLVAGPDWLAALASDGWAAERALQAVAPRFVLRAPVESESLQLALDKALAGDQRHSHGAKGDAAGALGDRPQFTARYDLSPALHLPLETASAVARVAQNRAEIWVAAQAPESVRQAVAKALDLNDDQVVLYPMAAGGSFDARYDGRIAVAAALAAKAVGKPVSMVSSSWAEQVAAIPRAPMAVQLSARADTSGGIAAWKMACAMPATMRELGLRLFSGDSPRRAADGQTRKDRLVMAGAMPPYAIEHMLVERAPVAITLPTGPMRGGFEAMHAFPREGFIDEIAHALGREPLSFRMGMLGGDPRLAACLQRVAGLAGWTGGGDGGGSGLALHRMGEGVDGPCIAAIVQARPSEQGVKVERITAVADLGRIVDAGLARQQVEGGLIFGLSLALGCSTEWQQGLPMLARLGQMGLAVLANCPEVEVELIEASAQPQQEAWDAGDIAVGVVAPALANALFSATGLRLRRLPLGHDE